MVSNEVGYRPCGRCKTRHVARSRRDGTCYVCRREQRERSIANGEKPKDVRTTMIVNWLKEAWAREDELQARLDRALGGRR